MKNLALQSLVVVSSLILWKCSGEETLNENSFKKKTAIQPPLKGVDVKSDIFSFQADEDQQILTKEGTIITIPANSLVDKNGKTVKGKVDLAYRSINSPAEIIASGIPLTYDSAGVAYDFLSAGMFEIHASQKGNDLEIKKGGNIQVDFASYKDGSEFSFYKIDEKKGDWSFKGKTNPTKNQGKVKRLEEFENSNLLVFDVDYSVHDELKAYNGLKWICIDEKGVDNPLKSKWMDKEYWYDITMKTLDESKGIYEVTLSNDKKNATFKVSPYLMEGETNADRIQAIASVNEAVAQRKELEQKIQLEADITRTFKISSFGTYNWDTIEKRIAEGALATTNASFRVDSEAVTKDMNVYLLSGKDNILSRITKKWDKLVYNPNEENKFLIILPDNYAAMSTTEEFKKAKNKANFEFSLKKVAKKIKSIEDLEALLASVH